MPGTRIIVNLWVKDKIPQQVNTEYPNLLPAIKAFKAKASKINAGQPNEEMTVIATYHYCSHDIDPHEACVPKEI